MTKRKHVSKAEQKRRHYEYVKRQRAANPNWNKSPMVESTGLYMSRFKAELIEGPWEGMQPGDNRLAFNMGHGCKWKAPRHNR